MQRSDHKKKKKKKDKITERDYVTERDIASISAWLLGDIKEMEEKISHGGRINVQEYEEQKQAISDKLRELNRQMIVTLDDLDNPHAALPLLGKLHDSLGSRALKAFKADPAPEGEGAEEAKLRRKKITENVREQMFEEYRDKYPLSQSHTEYANFLYNLGAIIKEDILSRSTIKENFVAIERWISLMKKALEENDFVGFNIIYGAIASIEVERLLKKSQLSREAKEFLEYIEKDKILNRFGVMQKKILEEDADAVFIPEFGVHKRAVNAIGEAEDRSQINELVSDFQAQQRRNKKLLHQFPETAKFQKLLARDNKPLMLTKAMDRFDFGHMEQFFQNYMSKYERKKEGKGNKKLQEKEKEKERVSAKEEGSRIFQSPDLSQSSDKDHILESRYNMAESANSVIRQIKSTMASFAHEFPTHEKLKQFEAFIEQAQSELGNALENADFLNRHMTGHAFKSVIKSKTELSEQLQELQNMLKKINLYISEELDDLAQAQSYTEKYKEIDERRKFEKEQRAKVSKKKGEKEEKEQIVISHSGVTMGKIPTHLISPYKSQRELKRPAHAPADDKRPSSDRARQMKDVESPRSPGRSPRIEEAKRQFDAFQSTGVLPSAAQIKKQMEDETKVSVSESNISTSKLKQSTVSPRSPRSPRSPISARASARSPSSGRASVRMSVHLNPQDIIQANEAQLSSPRLRTGNSNITPRTPHGDRDTVQSQPVTTKKDKIKHAQSARREEEPRISQSSIVSLSSDSLREKEKDKKKMNKASSKEEKKKRHQAGSFIFRRPTEAPPKPKFGESKSNRGRARTGSAQPEGAPPMDSSPSFLRHTTIVRTVSGRELEEDQAKNTHKEKEVKKKKKKHGGSVISGRKHGSFISGGSFISVFGTMRGKGKHQEEEEQAKKNPEPEKPAPRSPRGGGSKDK